MSGPGPSPGGDRTPAGVRVVLHVGTPSSATTHVQHVLARHRRELARRGVVHPLPRLDAHFLAAVDLLGGSFAGVPVPAAAGAWARLVDQVRQLPAGRAGRPTTVVISHELLGDAPPDVVARVVTDLAPATVEVVVTARDLLRQAPAAWQDDVRNGHLTTVEEHLAGLRAAPADQPWWAVEFWRRHDVPALLERWWTVVPPARTAVVTTPQRGTAPGLLWRRFASVLDDRLDLPDDAPVGGAPQLGRVEVELLRRLNATLGDRLPWPAYGAVVTHGLARDVLAHLPGSSPTRVPPADREWLRTRSRAQVSALAASGVRVVGDLDDLVPAPGPAGSAGGQGAAGGPSDAALLDAALHVLAELAVARGEAVAAPAWARRLPPRLRRWGGRALQERRPRR